MNDGLGLNIIYLIKPKSHLLIIIRSKAIVFLIKPSPIKTPHLYPSHDSHPIPHLTTHPTHTLHNARLSSQPKPPKEPSPSLSTLLTFQHFVILCSLSLSLSESPHVAAVGEEILIFIIIIIISRPISQLQFLQFLLHFLQRRPNSLPRRPRTTTTTTAAAAAKPTTTPTAVDLPPRPPRLPLTHPKAPLPLHPINPQPLHLEMRAASRLRRPDRGLLH
ncbi:hypothetical protein Sjap_001492 [Stephania japonica]|uniref:Uncharacterized protein n=1 Tax=Stephania japonica TaxID=461633 RepID=A0AAP0PRQ8_9MAGN